MYKNSLWETKNAVTLACSVPKRFPEGTKWFYNDLVALFVSACVDKWEKCRNEQENMFSLELRCSELLGVRKFASCA